MKKKSVILLIMFLFLLTGCKEKPKENPIVTMTIADYGEIKMELYPKIAPNTVANFVNLIEDGFYDGNNFHRLMKGFCLQGGDPTATGGGDAGYKIKGEFSLNGYTNKLSHTTGIVSMARATDYNSAGSQFFIVLSDNYTMDLDGKYAGFGKVIEGMDVIKEIENGEYEYSDEQNGILAEPIIIEKVTVDAKGYEYTVKKISN